MSKILKVLPSLKKGQLVRPMGRVNAWRRATGEETEAWHAKHREEVKAGRAYPYDSAGEPVLAPQDAGFLLDETMILTVVRARVSAPSGYTKLKECCQVFCPDNGQTLYVRRIWLTTGW
jgi:hypothetical protein